MIFKVARSGPAELVSEGSLDARETGGGFRGAWLMVRTVSPAQLAGHR
jgi:hypothetical protein